jgi:hypothetical protein
MIQRPWFPLLEKHEKGGTPFCFSVDKAVSYICQREKLATRHPRW